MAISTLSLQRSLFGYGCRLAVVLLAVVCSQRSLAADTIEFPEDELASESVLPIFDRAESVKNRAVRTSGRFELGPEVSLSLMEPFYNSTSLGGTASYHLSETNAINLYGTYFMQGLSDNGNNLNPIPTAKASDPKLNANLQYAPSPKYLFLANYQFTPFYGKISLTKEFVMNLSIFGFVGAGGIMVGDAFDPAIDFGIGQKLYFTPSFALRIDLRFFGYNGPDVLSRDLSAVSSVQPASSFDQKLIFSGLMSVGAVFLL